jgi:hypothetical protein
LLRRFKKKTCIVELRKNNFGRKSAKHNEVDEEEIQNSIESWDWQDADNDPEVWMYTDVSGIKDKIKEKLVSSSQKIDFGACSLSYRTQR